MLSPCSLKLQHYKSKLFFC
ncbi:MAG: hypothetical protein J7L34_01795 [Thermotogaceae bacterium]|nr:hypothetical protein [Thermotogaceae bacterium]